MIFFEVGARVRFAAEYYDVMRQIAEEMGDPPIPRKVGTIARVLSPVSYTVVWDGERTEERAASYQIEPVDPVTDIGRLCNSADPPASSPPEAGS